MFKELLQLFGHHAGFGEVHDRFNDAFGAATNVFAMAHEALWSEDTSEETARRIYAADIEVNKAEREVRQRIVRHLSVQQGLDIIWSLRIMSLVKDVERIGDYAKNMFEVGGLLTGPLEACALRDDVRAHGDAVVAYLRAAVEIFDASDEKRARKAVADGRELAKRAEGLVQAAARHEGSANTAVCLALAARHLKRGGSHGMNVLTGLTMPIHKLDYFDEDELDPNGANGS